MEWDINVAENGHILSLRGSATLPYAAALKEALVAALEAGNNISVDAQEVDEFDLAGLQLLGTAHHSAVAQGKTLQLQNGQPAFYEAVRAAGFDRKKSCSVCPHDAPCLWVMTDQDA